MHPSHENMMQAEVSDLLSNCERLCWFFVAVLEVLMKEIYRRRKMSCTCS